MHNNILGHIKSDLRRINKKAVITGAIILLLIGILSSVLTFLLGGRSIILNFLELPSWAPPRFIFPLIWTAMYILIGGAAGMVLCGRDGFREVDKLKGLLLFIVMMIFNVIWCPLFFAAFAFFLAFLDIVIMIILTIFIIHFFRRIFFIAGLAMVIHIIWLFFCLILNFCIMLAN
jgi:tryptophan-rich sensory protein